MIAILIFLMSISLVCLAGNTNKMDKIANTNQVAKVEKEKKLEHFENKIVVKERDKGSKKESDWKAAKEFPIMFKNNRKGRPAK
jgi:hypothetical protein